jgi:hypothetical protein
MAQTGSTGLFRVGALLVKPSIVLPLTGSGAPTNAVTGAGVAGPGSFYIRTSNGAVYVNTNTKASPTWTQLGSVAALTSAHIFVGNGSNVGTDVAVSGDVTISNAGVVAIGAGKVTNAMVVPAALDGTVAKVVADVNVIGGIPVLHRIACAALTGDVTVVLTHKTRVVDVWAVSTGAGGSGDTITVKNVATAITDVMDLNIADKLIARALSIDDAQHEIAAGANLVISGASAVNAIVYVLGVRVT